MAVKKKAARKVSGKHKGKVNEAIKKAEDQIIANYKKVSSMSGEDWKKASQKYKKHVRQDMSKVKKRVDAEIKKNPAGAAVAAAIIGALAGAIIMSKLRKK